MYAAPALKWSHTLIGTDRLDRSGPSKFWIGGCRHPTVAWQALFFFLSLTNCKDLKSKNEQKDENRQRDADQKNQ